VRGRRKQDQRVRAARQQLGQAGTHGVVSIRDVVALVDDDDVPGRVFEVVAVLQVALEGVHGDDRAVVVVERIVGGGDPASDAPDAGRVQTHQRDGEAVPELLLELRQHALERDHQDAPATTAADQFGHQDAGLEGLAQPHGVCDQDALPWLCQRHQRWLELVVDRIHRAVRTRIQAVVTGDARAQQALDVQQALHVLRGRV